ncbi:hypothetical protein [Pseudonocardia hydrocarbonoxydans]|uniref:Uncharacterized protein n=1 Tax=Pseudonocardia hydrocarbonoxydans TaxID=76726 RepID=A0A4Y3WQM8_9PSEU|nr:hypothetical protein [Pseudonocardia hydrocarbonoxydans]GEC19666.1 hypothetical protein PHY01_19490 [Pseudonocardia hydrocarbonoxydans]
MPPAPEVRCVVTDDRLAELSGMLVDDGAIWAMSDGGREVTVHRLDDDCAVAQTRTAGIDPFDAEDLALGPDGEYWVADTGDNERSRETVAAIVLPVRGEARLHRFTYPDGPHDAEALVVDADGVPFVITKEVGAPAGVYRPAAPPEGRGPFPLERVAQVSLPASDTEGGPIGGVGTRTVTGAALSADGTVLALRTYTDAWLFPVDGGDVAAALSGQPTRIPLPGEPQGEAVAFEADGTLLSASETRVEPGELRAVPGAAALAGQPGPPPAAPVAPVEEPAPEWLPALLGGGVTIGVLVLLAAALSWRARSR